MEILITINKGIKLLKKYWRAEIIQSKKCKHEICERGMCDMC